MAWSFRPEIDGVSYWSHVDHDYDCRSEQGAIKLPAGIVLYYTQAGNGSEAPPYSRLTFISRGTVYERTFEKPYAPRYLKTLARRWLAEDQWGA